MNNLKEYIDKCETDKFNVENKLDNFMKILYNIEKDPRLIFTDFFVSIDNPIYTIANYNGDVLDKIMLPIIKTLPYFKDIKDDLLFKTDGSYDSFKIYDNKIVLMNINLKKKQFINYCLPLNQINVYGIREKTLINLNTYLERYKDNIDSMYVRQLKRIQNKYNTQMKSYKTYKDKINNIGIYLLQLGYTGNWNN